MMQIRGRHFETLKPIVLHIADQHIAGIETLECSELEAAKLPIVAPGFFDIQVNGYNGIWFCSPSVTVDHVEQVTQALIDRGIAQYFPTLITASYEALHHGFTTLRNAVENHPVVAATVAGYHLEGPYISSEDGPRGAHPKQHVRPADYDEFSRLQEASGNNIRLVTLAAEAINAVPFIERCRRDGVVVSLGHMAASANQIKAAVDAGAQLSTHLGNGAHATLRRHPNYIWEQLADDRLTASIIADGWHLPDSVLNCFYRCKDLDRIILTCDASGFAGCQPGTYDEGGVAVEVLEDGRIVVAGQRQFLAGSGATTGDCVVHMSHACQLPLAASVQMATGNPAKLFGSKPVELTQGAAATLTVFHVLDDPKNSVPQFAPVATLVKGRTLSKPLKSDS